MPGRNPPRSRSAAKPIVNGQYGRLWCTLVWIKHLAAGSTPAPPAGDGIRAVLFVRVPPSYPLGVKSRAQRRHIK